MGIEGIGGYTAKTTETDAAAILEEQARLAKETAANLVSLLGSDGIRGVSVTGAARGVDGTVKTRDVTAAPELDEEMLDSEEKLASDLESLIAKLQVETDSEQLAAAKKRLETLKDSYKPAHEGRMKKIDKSITEMKKAEDAAKAKKALGWLGVVFSAVVATVVPIATGGLAAGLAWAGFAVALTSAILDQTGASAKITKAIANSLQSSHPGWSKAQCEAVAGGIYGGIFMVLGLATAIGGGFAGGLTGTVQKVAQVAGYVMQAANYTTSGVATAFNYESGMSQADVTETQAILKKIEKAIEDCEDELNELLQQLMDAFNDMMQLIDTKVETQNKMISELGA